MNDFQSKVSEFHKAFGVPVHDRPQVSIGKDHALLRARLIIEEAKETIAGMCCCLDYDPAKGESHVALIGDDVLKLDLVEIADGLADLVYVCCGAALEFGIDLQEIFDEVHSSNMSKMWTFPEWNGASDDFKKSHTIAYCPEFYDKGTRCIVVKREDGKIIKSPSYRPANILAIIENRAKEGGKAF